MRLAEQHREQLTERQRETYDRIANGPRLAVRGPFIAWLRSPIFADQAEAMGNYLRFHSSLPNHVRELAVLMVARRWNATFVWQSHLSLALQAGLPAEVIEAIRTRQSPHLSEEDGRVYEFLEHLLDAKSISDQTWSSTQGTLGDQGIVDLIGMTGYYTMVVMTIVATELGAELPSPFSG